MEGWRGIPHSFSVVAADLLKELAGRPGLDLSWADVPLPPHWEAIRRQNSGGGGRKGAAGVHNDDDDDDDASSSSSGGGLPVGVAVLPYDDDFHGSDGHGQGAHGVVGSDAVVLRLSYPLDLSLHPVARRTVSFVAAERLCVEHGARLNGDSNAAPWPVAGAAGATLLAPSRWAAEAFVRTGVPRGRVAVAPHGVDTAVFRPLATDDADKCYSGAAATTAAAAAAAAVAEKKHALRRKVIGGEYFEAPRKPKGGGGGRSSGKEEEKKKKKKKKSYSPQQWRDRVVFLHVGAMTPNKGVPLLVRAFQNVLSVWDDDDGDDNGDDGSDDDKNSKNKSKNKSKKPKSKRPTSAPPLLVLKGLDNIYDSRRALSSEVSGGGGGGGGGGGYDNNNGDDDPVSALLFRGDRKPGWRAGAYLGGELSRRALADLYRCADVYVTASKAEGFGLPLLEAAAVGLTIVVPAGAAAEEITEPSFTRYVESRLVASGTTTNTNTNNNDDDDDDDDDKSSSSSSSSNRNSNGGGGDFGGNNPRGCVHVEADTRNLTAALADVASDGAIAFRRRAAAEGPAFVARWHSLAAAADKVLAVLQDDQWAS